MSLRAKNPRDIGKVDLQRLVDDQVRESQTLEYKRDPYGRNDAEVREMLRDISSMGNAFGGDLLIGIEEDRKGIAIGLPGVENAEVEARRIVSSCLSNIEERILGLIAWPVPLTNARHVIVVRIPRSLRAPHMVTFKGINQFWTRHDRQKSPMSIHEIREACLKVEGLMEKLERFLEKRKEAIRAAIGSLPYYIVSLTPVFVDTEVLDIKDSKLKDILFNPPDQRPGGWNLDFDVSPKPTLHGLSIDVSGSRVLELFRNGYLELRVHIDEGSFCRNQIEIHRQRHLVLHAHAVVEYAVSLLRLGKAIHSYLGLTDLAVFSLTMLNVRGFALACYPNDEKRERANVSYGPQPWNEKDLEVEPRQVLSLEEPDKVAKDFVDRIWQAFGFEQAPLFDAEGNFAPGD